MGILSKKRSFFNLILGDLKVAYQTLTDEGASLKRKLAVLGLIAIPHAQAVGKTIRWGASKAFSFLKDVYTSPSAKPGFILINPKILKRIPKAAQSTGREIVLDKVKSFEQARNKALEILGDLGHDAKPKIGKFHVLQDKVVGRQSVDGKALWRLDYDLTKGPHINVIDFRFKRSKEMAIPFEGTMEDVLSLLRHLNK